MVKIIRTLVPAFLLALFIAGGCVAAAGSGMAQLALASDDLPFPVARAEGSYLPADTAGGMKGIARMYSASFISGRSASGDGTALVQVIMECTPGNATPVYYSLYRAISESQEGGNYFRVIENPGIGEKSFAFSAMEQYGPGSTYVIRGILFKKGNYVEYIATMYPEDDPVAISTVARAAAAKIPSARTVPAPVTLPQKVRTPVPAPSPAAGGQPSGDLLVWYDFEDDVVANGSVMDRSGSGRDGVVTGTVRAADGIGGTKGIAFSGNGYLLAPDNPAAKKTKVTFSFWFKTDDPTRNYKFASAAEWYGGPGTGWTMATHRPEFWADDGVDDLLIPAQPNADNHFVPDTWTHEAVVYDGSTMKEYTNGVLINTWKARGVPMSAGVPMAVGGWPQFSGYNYAGEMDDFRIYDRALAAGEIAAIAGMR